MPGMAALTAAVITRVLLVGLSAQTLPSPTSALPESPPHQTDALEDALKGRGRQGDLSRVQSAAPVRSTSAAITARHRTAFGRSRDLAVTHDHICVDLIKRITGTETAPDFSINLTARDRYIERRITAARKSPDPRRVVALMRPANEHVATIKAQTIHVALAGLLR